MNISLLRKIVAGCCVISIAGMIVTNIKGAIGGAIAFGMLGAIAMTMLIVANAVLRPSNHGGAQEALGAELEARVQDLIRAGASEEQVRDVVRKAVRFGQGEP